MSALAELGRAPFARVLLIGLLGLLLQIPVSMIADLGAARQQSRDEAVADLARTWGGRQEVMGPFLVVPYRVMATDDKGRVYTRDSGTVTILPEHYEIEARPQVEARRRGLFEVPVYRAQVQLSGRFAEPRIGAGSLVPAGSLQWREAQLALRLADVHALDRVGKLKWRSATIDFEAGGGLNGGAGIHAPLPQLDAAASAGFSIDLELRGSQGLYFAPLGRETRALVRSQWPHPAFQGAWLPAQREVTAQGFAATWNVTNLARGLPSAWKDGAGAEALPGTLFGVDLLYPVDPYRMTERSLKYSLLFVGLSFLVLWLFELLARRPVHLVQYLMFGAALCLFYLLELSLAEHFGFAAAYAIAATAVTSQVSLYARAALGGWGGAGLVLAVVSALYALLYLLLREEDYALLVGSGALFAVLSLVMFLTRAVRWDRASAEAPARQ